MKKGCLRNFTKFTGKQLCQRLFFNKVAGLSPATLLKKRLWHKCVPVNFVKFLRTNFLQNTSGRLLLQPGCTQSVHMHFQSGHKTKVIMSTGREHLGLRSTLRWSFYANQFKSSRSQMFFKIVVLKNFAVIKGKHLR